MTAGCWLTKSTERHVVNAKTCTLRLLQEFFIFAVLSRQVAQPGQSGCKENVEIVSDVRSG